MGLHPHRDVEVAWGPAEGSVLPLPPQYQLGAVIDALGHLDVEAGPAPLEAVAPAGLARRLGGPPPALAPVAGRHPDHLPEEGLGPLLYPAAPVAPRAGRQARPRLCPVPPAPAAGLEPVQAYLDLGASGGLFEGHLYPGLEVAAPPGARADLLEVESEAPAEDASEDPAEEVVAEPELGEDVPEVGSPEDVLRGISAADAGVAEHVVLLLLLGVGEDGVGL